MTLAVRGRLWSVVYLILVVAPLFFMIVGDPPPARGFWMELSIAHGAFTYERNEAPGFVFVAGGIGITPIMSMLHTLADRGDRRPVWLIYANPTWDETAYLDELRELEDRLELKIVHVLDDPPDGWEGETGFVTPEVLDRHLPEDEHRLEHFVCGPDPMMDAVVTALHDRGIPGEKVNLERFDFL